jgi:hypothetical protein
MHHVRQENLPLVGGESGTSAPMFPCLSHVCGIGGGVSTRKPCGARRILP